MSKALVVQNGEKGGPRRLDDWLRGAGVDLDVVHAYRGDPLPERLEHDALIVLGGGYLPSDDEKAPWLAPARRLVGEALARSVPYFGICLGGQMLAEVAGGAVKGEHGSPEHGSTPITIRPEAASDPLFYDLPDVVPAIEHHVDAITALPGGATWLAETEKCPYQAFRVGECAWGVQFHPEAAPDRIPQWSGLGDGFDPAEIYRRAVAEDPVAAPIWEDVTNRFAKLVPTSTL